MNDKIFDYIGITDTVRNWPYLPEDDRITQIFCDHFMSQQLDATTSYNCHKSLPGPYQHGGTSSLTTGNLIGRRLKPERDTSGLGI